MTPRGIPVLHSIAMQTFHVRAFGCQMNKHDSERVAGMLRACGMDHIDDIGAADVIVFLTCCVRENADERLTGTVTSLARGSAIKSKAIVAVGGCIGQRDGTALLRQMPGVDIVFGTHNVGRLPDLLGQALESDVPVVEVLESTQDFASDLPSEREHRWHAWLPITVGCNNFCTYCIVPYVRGSERSRAIEAITDEAKRLVADGVVEITLLGQNVNSYGRDLYGSPRFPHVLSAVADTGVSRIRFATSHPKDLSEETIDVMASTPQVCDSLHLPFQSGSDRILAAMNRHYTKESYLSLVDRLYDAMPDLALSTDIIVGFPGETADDFEHTLDVVRAARFDQAFTFIYSPRDGTPAASMPNQVPRDVAQERFDRLVELVQASALEKNRALEGKTVRVLVEGASKRDTAVLSGRTEGNKVVHAPVPPTATVEQLAGTFIDVHVRVSRTWFLAGDIV